MNKNNIIIPAGCAVAGIIVGFVGGVIFGKHKYKKFYENKYNDDIYEYRKKDIEGEIPSEEKREEIAKASPESTELWTESFKKQHEKMKEYKNVVRREGYSGEDVPDDEIFDNDKFEKENYDRCKQYFEDQLEAYSEYSGISKNTLINCEVRVIPEEEYFEETHDSEPVDLQWDPYGTVLRDEDGEHLEPEITFGRDWRDIIEYAEQRPDQITYVHDERLDNYYTIEIENPRTVK